MYIASYPTQLFPILVPQSLNIHNLLHRLGRQNKRPLVIHTNTILNAYRQPPEMPRPPLVIGYVDARLNGHHVTAFQRDPPPVPRDIVHIQSDVMAQMMGEQHVQPASSSVQLETQTDELFAQFGLGDAVDDVETEALARGAELDAVPLHGEHGLVQVALGGGEFARDGPGAGDVGYVGAVFAACVDEDGRGGV